MKEVAVDGYIHLPSIVRHASLNSNSITCLPHLPPATHTHTKIVCITTCTPPSLNLSETSAMIDLSVACQFRNFGICCCLWDHSTEDRSCHYVLERQDCMMSFLLGSLHLPPLLLFTWSSKNKRECAANVAVPMFLSFLVTLPLVVPLTDMEQWAQQPHLAIVLLVELPTKKKKNTITSLRRLRHDSRR